MAGKLDPDAPLREPVRIGNRYPAIMQPLTTVRHLLAFAHVHAEKQEGDASDWQLVYEELLRAETLLDMTIAIARYPQRMSSAGWEVERRAPSTVSLPP